MEEEIVKYSATVMFRKTPCRSKRMSFISQKLEPIEN